MFRNGHYLETPVSPSKNGYEASGIIEAVGSEVDSSWIGKTVSTIPERSNLTITESTERWQLLRVLSSPLSTRTFPFAEIVEAHRYMESNAQIGKIVVTL